MAWNIPSEHADAVEEEYRLLDAHIAAMRAGRLDDAKQLISEMLQAQQRRRETWRS